MSARLRRHTITETPRISAALNELRAELGHDGRIDLGELVVLGARIKARELREGDPAGQRSRGRLADLIRARAVPVDVRAADEAKRASLIC